MVGDLPDSSRSRLRSCRLFSHVRIALWTRVSIGLLLTAASLVLATAGGAVVAVVQIVTVIVVAVLLARGPRRQDLPRCTRGLLLAALGVASRRA
jgi:hypothetical protein